MLDTVSTGKKRLAISKGRIAVLAVIAFLTLSFFAIGFSAVEEARGSPAAVQQQNGAEGDNIAIAAFKFV